MISPAPDPRFAGVDPAEFIREADCIESTGCLPDGTRLKNLWQANAAWRCEKHRFVKDKAGKIRSLAPLKLAQRKLLAVFRYCEEHGLPIRVVIGKSRKQGMSTMVAEYFYTRVVRDQSDALIVAHDKDTANWIYGIYARYYQYDDLPKPLPYSGGKISAREMKFADHDGKIKVATARNEFAGTGTTPQLIHESESAKWENGAETLTALNQCIGDGPETAQVKESTFNGMEDCFLPVWKAAYDNSKLEFEEDETGCLHAKFTITNHREHNGYIPLFISVLDDEDARKPFLSDLDRERFEGTLDKDEIFLMTQHGACLEFLNWRRWAIKNKCRNNLDVFHQEYPCNPVEAIRASGRPRFDTEKLDHHVIEEGQTGRLERDETRWNKPVIWHPDKGENLTIFRHPLPSHFYLVGCDTGEDSDFEDTSAAQDEKLDKTAIVVCDLTAGDEEVALYHAIRKPNEVFTPLLMIAKYYNDAFVVIECNAAGNVACIEMGKAYDASLLFHRGDDDPTARHGERAVGHRTTMQSRETMIGQLADAITNNEVQFHSEKTIAEMRNFVIRRKRGSIRDKAQAASGYHDDIVIAWCKTRVGRAKAMQIFENRRKMQSRQSAPVLAAQALTRIRERQRQGMCASTGY